MAVLTSFTRGRRATTLVLTALYVALAVLTVLPPLRLWRTTIVGDNRDALLNLTLMNWVSHQFLHWHTLWRGQFFQPHPLTTAYSDLLLPQAIVLAIFRSVAGAALAFNLVELLAWVTGLWSMHLLLRRFSSSDVIGVLGAVGWSFSTARLAHLEHPQLVIGGAFVPVALLLLLRFLEHPSLLRGVSLGVSVSVVTLAANYFGVMTAVTVAVVAVIVVAARRCPVRTLVPGVVGAAITIGVLVIPVWLQYHHLEADPYFKRSPAVFLSTHPSGLLEVSSNTPRLARTPGLGVAGNPELPAFPGIVLGVLGSAGLLFLARRSSQRRVEAIGIVVAGLLMLVLSGGGYGWTLGFSWLRIYRAAEVLVPGFAGIRAPARFALVFELAVAVSAVVALEAIRRHSREVFFAVIALASVLLVLETRADVPTVRLPDRVAWTGVNHVLARRPRGLTAELPVVPETRGWVWGYTETPRLWLARIDGHPRINGYSGFEPPGLEYASRTINEFPSIEAVAWLQAHDVRYLIVRDGPVGYMPDTDRAAIESLWPTIDRAAIARLASDRPSWMVDVRRVGDATLFELRTTGARGA